MPIAPRPITAGTVAILALLALNASVAGDLWQQTDSTQVLLDAEALEQALSGRADGITITVDDVAWVVEVAPRTVHRGGRRSLRGAIAGLDDSYFLLCSSADGATAAVFRPPGSAGYRLQWSGDAYHVLSLDPDEFEPCAGAMEPPPWSVDHAPPPHPPEDRSAFTRDLGDVADDGSRHDILVAYTEETMNAAGGASFIEAEIQLAVDAANYVYDNSLMTSSLRLVATALTGYDEDTAWNYEEHLYMLADPTDDQMDELPVLRDRVGADFVSLIIESVDIFGEPTGACGVGFIMQSHQVGHDFEWLAYSVVSRRCASSVWTLAHEVGHNRGCAHNREDAGFDGAYPYSYGHRYTGDDGLGYRTVMSYDTDPPSFERLPVFSHPDLEYQGEPVGVPIGEPGEAHCSHTHEQTSPVCAGFRSERTFVEFGWTGDSDGLVHTPFATIAEAVAASRIAGTIMLRGDGPAVSGLLAEPRIYRHDGDGSTVLGDQ